MRLWVWPVSLTFATTSAFAATPGSRLPTTEINLTRGGAASAPGLGGAGIAATPSAASGGFTFARPAPSVAAPLPAPEFVPKAGGLVPPAGTPPRSRASSGGFKHYLLDEMDAMGMQPALTLGPLYFDGVKARPVEIDPAAAARRERVPASQSPAAKRHDAPDIVPPKPGALVQMNRSPHSEMYFNKNATRLLDGAAKWHDNVIRFSPGWKKAAVGEAIERHMGAGYQIKISPTGKLIYVNPVNGRQIVIDAGNGYFRIFQPDSPGSKNGKYLNLDGEVPMMEIMTKNGLKRVPMSQGQMNQATHFIIQNSPRATQPPPSL